MAEISGETVKKLIKLGILDANLNITPSALIPSLQRQSLKKQCETLGIRLIYRRPTKRDTGLESQMCKYLVNHYGGFANSDEGYWIKNLLAALVDGFDARIRTHRLNKNELMERCAQISNIDDARIVCWYEQNLYDDVEFHGEIVDMSPSALRSRFKTSKSLNPRWNKGYIKRYVYNVTEILALWRSITLDTWSHLALETLSDWENMYSGWPDVTYVDKHGQLRLFEIKGNDKLHANQIYMLQKLILMLGEDRIAVIRVGHNEWTQDGLWYSRHLKETDSWLSKKTTVFEL